MYLDHRLGLGLHLRQPHRLKVSADAPAEFGRADDEVQLESGSDSTSSEEK